MKTKNVGITVAVDYDDVLAQCNSYALNLLNQKKGTAYSLKDIVRWGSIGNSLDQRLVYFQDPEFVASQPLYPEATEFVEELRSIANVVIATDVPKQCISARKKELHRNFPGIPYFIGKNKNQTNPDIILDDAVHHLQCSSAVQVLYSRPWNLNEKTSFIRVNTYNEFLKLVQEVCTR